MRASFLLRAWTAGWLLLCTGLAAQAAATPLSADEAQAVLAEAELAMRLPSRQRQGFRAQLATPERVERLLHSPALAEASEPLRAQVLALAGPGEGLRFDQPSDVLALLERLLPAELARARDARRPLFSLDLPGPYPHWSGASIAWAGLWHCWPRAAWLEPQRSPFRRGAEVDHAPLAGPGGAVGAEEFRTCLNHHNGAQHLLGEAERAAAQAALQDMTARATPVLSAAFARHLRRAGCAGQGPDDCVLVLLAWSQLAPADPELWQALQRLESAVAPSAPLPGWRKDPGSYQGHQTLGEPRHVELTRRAAFLRAKLAALLAEPARRAGPAFGTLLAQLSELARQHADTIDWRWSQFDLRSDARFNPWALLHLGAEEGVFDAVLAHLDREVAAASSCPPQQLWFESSGRWGEELRSLLAERAQRRPGPSCHGLDWAALRAGATPALRALRERQLARLPAVSGAERERILSGLTANGADCFAAPLPAAVPVAVAAACRRWIHAPQHAPLKALMPGRSVDAETEFQTQTWRAPGGHQAPDWDWLEAGAEGLSAPVAAQWRALLAGLQAEGRKVFEATQWRRPGHSQVLVQLVLADNAGTRQRFTLSAQGLQRFEVPPRFEKRDATPLEIVRVSDLDQDGRLELWWAQAHQFERCDGSPADLQRDLHCRQTHAELGEIDGDSLGYFVADAPQAAGAPAAELPPSWHRPRTGEVCNEAHVARWLAAPLKLRFGRSEAPRANEVLRWTCAAHPDEPGQLLVALFHASARADRQGFVLALVDTGPGRLLRHGRMAVEVDALDQAGGALALDTAPYSLQPGRRAIGVRMAGADSPRWAEGGQGDYLTLFVPEGDKNYRLVLERLPMSTWSLGGDLPACFQPGQTGCIRFEARRSLSLANSQTAGWRDLILREQIRSEPPGHHPGPDADPAPLPKLLRMGSKGRYQ
ncbi:hypothetical protein [Inhella sp.]|uniref:hypothetical protein n=1 Tax=Inhella sp. TaxID=1921806 RepID=UPI0035B47689